MYQWKNPMMDFWLKSVSGAGSYPGTFGSSFFMWPDQGQQSGGDNPWQTSMKMAQSMYDSFSWLWGGKREESSQSASISNLLLSLAQMGLEGYVDLQEQWLRSIREADRASGTGEREDFIKTSSIWIDSFQKLIKPFLNVPTVGLTRSYQEQANQVVEKYYVFTGNVTELLYQLNIPMEEASKRVKAQMEEYSRTGKCSDGKEPYDSWLKTMEDGYMDLFQSPAYIQLLYKTVDSYNDFLVAQQQVCGNSLRNLPVPTTKDLDELSKEIYMLKKKLREMTRKMDASSHPADQGNGSFSQPVDQEDATASDPGDQGNGSAQNGN